MPTFRYQALDANQEPVAGQLEAESVQQAIAALAARGLSVQSIGLAAPATDANGASGESTDESNSTAAPDAPADAEPLALEKRVAAVLEQSRAIVPALAAYAEEMPTGRRRELLKVCGVLESGDAAAATDALATMPQYWIPLLSSAASAEPARVLRKFVEASRQANDLRQQWVRALAYPAVVAIMAAAVIVALSFVISPAFRVLFNDFGLRLPAITTFVLSISDSIQNGDALWFLLIVLAIMLAALYARRFLPAAESSWLGERLFGWFGRSPAIAQICRSTADLLEAGLDEPEALRIAALASRKLPIRNAGLQVADELQAGPIARSRREPRALTSTVAYALKTPMPTAARIALLKEIGASYFDRAQNRLSWTHGIVGPAAMCAVGFIVGVAVLGLFLPLVDLINNLSG